ncbi:hypothetical protein GCM10022420_040540 [Streptomyces iranensis]
MFAAAGPLPNGIGGVYLKDNDISPLDEDPAPSPSAPTRTLPPMSCHPPSTRGPPRGGSGHQTLAVGVDDRLHTVAESEFGEDA